MAEIQVTAAQLKSKADELRNLNSNFKTQVGNLESQEQDLVGMWEGEARNEFHKQFGLDKAQFDAFYQLIEKYCEALTTIAAKYADTEINTETIASTRSS